MKRTLSLAFVAALSLATQASAQSRQQGPTDTIRIINGSPTLLGTLTATTTKNNSDTAVPFTIVGGQFLLVQCDASTYLLPGDAATSTVTTANGVKVIADEKYYLMLKTRQAYLAALAVSGTVNCKVWRLD